MYVEEMCVDVIKKNKFLESLKQVLYLPDFHQLNIQDRNSWKPSIAIAILGFVAKEEGIF